MQIGWIDFSKEERNKMVSILRLLDGHNALDEIGIGGVRDAFSDKLFPGISVLQTKAKYFVLVPYLFDIASQEQDKKGKFKTNRDVLRFINDKETELARTLMKNSAGQQGIIGSRSGGDVKQKPSQIYWNGMRTSEILLHPSFSLDMACQTVLARNKTKQQIKIKVEDKNSGADDKDNCRDGHVIFSPIVPTYNVLQDAHIELTKDEADYLFDHFTKSAAMKGTLMEYMLRHPEMVRDYTRFSDINPEVLKNSDGDLYDRVRLARQFADFIYGAHLLYNIVFADGCNYEDDKVLSVKKEYQNYLEKYNAPDLNEIIDMAQPDASTIIFLRKWAEGISTDNQKALRQLIVDRECQVKPRRNKLNRPDAVQFTEPIHFYKLSYRYDTARTIMNDILEGRGINSSAKTV